jgi:hypothetical protein
MLTTVHLFLEITYVKIPVPVTEIFRRYLAALILGLVFERYIRVLPMQHNSPETVYKFTILLWLKTTFLYGVLYFGFGMATFSLLFIKFILGFSFSAMMISLPATIFYAYTMFFILGFCIGNFMYIVLYIGVKYKQKKNRNQSAFSRDDEIRP